MLRSEAKNPVFVEQLFTMQTTRFFASATLRLRMTNPCGLDFVCCYALAQTDDSRSLDFVCYALAQNDDSLRS